MLKKIMLYGLAALCAIAVLPSKSQAYDIDTWTGQGLRRNLVEVRISSDGTLYSSSETVKNRLTMAGGSKYTLAGPIHLASAGVTVPYYGSYTMFDTTAGPVNFTAGPILATATARNGDTWTIVNISTKNIILRDQNTSLHNSGIHLSSSVHVFGPNDVLDFVFNASTNGWVQRSFGDTR